MNTEQRNETNLRQMQGGTGYGLPKCPTCGSEDVTLGTSNAYAICAACRETTGHAEQYWGTPHAGGYQWDDAIMASPWARKTDVVRILTAKEAT